MKVYLDCIPCSMRQALEAARRVSEDTRVQRAVLDKVATLIPDLPLDANPVDLGREIHRIVKELTACRDPYSKQKKEYNDRALALFPQLKTLVEDSPDPLLTSLEIATAGNIIDFGANESFDLDHALKESARNGFSPSDYPLLQEHLQGSEDVLYLGDNAGEIVFDKLVVQQLNRLGKKVTFVVRGQPIINDVTIEDASYVGMDSIATVIANGSDAPGTSLRYCSEEFSDVFSQAKLILAKGHGNFEGLSDDNAPLFFLLKVKCQVVANELDASIGNIVLRAQRCGAQAWNRTSG